MRTAEEIKKALEWRIDFEKENIECVTHDKTPEQLDDHDRAFIQHRQTLLAAYESVLMFVEGKLEW